MKNKISLGPPYKNLTFHRVNNFFIGFSWTKSPVVSKSGSPAFEQVHMHIQEQGHCFEVYKSSNMPLQPI